MAGRKTARLIPRSSGLLIALAVLLAFIVPASAYAGEEPPFYVSVEALPERTDVAAGEEIRVGLRFRMVEGWHIYWKNAGDSGEPPKMDWHVPAGTVIGSVSWPVPSLYIIGPLTNFGYEGDIILTRTMTMPDDLPSDAPSDFHVAIDVLVCADICIPEKHSASFTLNDGTNTDHSAALDAAVATLPARDVAAQARYNISGDDFILDIEFHEYPNDLGNIELYDFDMLPVDWGVTENSASTRVFTRPAEVASSGLLFAKKRDNRDPASIGDLEILLRYQAAGQDAKAFYVTAVLDPALEASPALSADDVADLLPDGVGGIVSSPVNMTLMTALVFALLGGVILNLMPCVFPVLSMKALKLCKMNDQSEARARLHGLAYMAGILLSFAVLAGALIVLQIAGAQAGWGFQLQNPVIVLFLTYLLFLIGLNLAGFFEIGGGGIANLGGNLAGRDGLGGSFFTGVLATIVATPCTAPFMGAAMGFAMTQPPAVTMTVFLALGLGLALPYLALAFVPPLRAALPKPGPWMEKFKQFLAFPMLAAAAWLLWVYSLQTSDIALFYAVIGLVLTAFAIWVFRHSPHGRKARLIVRVLVALALAGMIYVMIHESRMAAPVSRTAESAGAYEWTDFSNASYEASIAGDRPVFVNMTAAWCITCKANERVAIDVDRTRSLFRALDVHYIKGDWTNQNPSITAYLKRYGRNGVPIYVYYGARDPATGERPDAVMLPQLLTPGIVAAALEGGE